MASQALLDLIAAKRASPYSDEQTVEELRSETEARIEANPVPDGTQVEAVSANGVPAEWINAPGSSRDRAIYFIHGGGYYRGTVASSRSPAAEMSAACGAQCLSIDYRLAPEHPFPAAIDDVYSGYQWLLEQGFSPQQVVVSGISAGGGLTGALLLKLKQLGEPMPAGAVPLSPWMDLTQSGRSYLTQAEADPSINKAYLDRMAAYYLAGHDPKDELASPMFGDLAGLPPLLIQVGSAETLLDDSVEFGREAGAAEVDVTVEIWAELIHGWHGSPQLPETADAMGRIAAFFNRVTG